VRCCARIAGGVRNVRSTRRAWYAAWAALLLYPLAVSLPILRIERMGETHESSVWSGSLGLMANGDVVLGLVVFVCSVVVPLGKLATLLVLIGAHARVPFAGRVHAWHALELTGRFGMIDVLLVSGLVAWLELGASR
jgi:paraquat-inducible protein A